MTCARNRSSNAPMKDPHAVALGRKAKGKPKTVTPASIAARQANAAKGRAVMAARREAAK